MKDKLYEEIKQLEREMIEIRRYLHQYPELSFQEEKTPAYIAEFHRQLGHEVRTGVGGAGVVATLHGAKPGKTVAVRADFDALPVQEENDIPYKSKVPGVMHACGHDGHTAIVLGLSKALNRLQSEIAGTIVFIHQHAEEIVPGGARAMIQDGCLKGVDAIYGAHLWAPFPLGEIRIKSDSMLAASDKFEIELTGKGGHAGLPHETNDVIVAAAQLVVNLQSIVSRRINPFEPVALSIGSLHAGQSFNVIPESAKLLGTVRSFNESVRQSVETEMKNIVDSAGRAAGISARLNYEYGYPAVINHPDETKLVIDAARDAPGVTDIVSIQPMMISEDFAYYLNNVRGAFFFIGAKDPNVTEPHPHHHAKFMIDERALQVGASVLGSVVLHSLHNID